MMRDGIIELGSKRIGFSKKKGNFREMIERSLALGHDIKIPTPLDDMKPIVRKNNYQKTYEPHEDPELGMVEVWVMEAPQNGNDGRRS